MPSERVQKSASVVPAVVEATIVAQYSHGLKVRARTWIQISASSTAPNSAVPIR